MSDRPRLLYLLAPSYSGTTLLTYLLSQHKRIATIGELKATRMGMVDQYQCSCGVMIRDCEFWRELQKDLAAQGVRFSVEHFDTAFGSKNPLVNRVIRASVRGPWFEQLRSWVLAMIPERVSRLGSAARRNFVVSQAICRMHGGDIFLDGSKDPARLLHLMRSGLWDIRVICMHRDGRGVSNSYKNHDGMSYDQAIEYWLQTMQELRRMRSRIHDDHAFDLRYEELCTEPARVMSDIWSWLRVESQPLVALGLIAAKSHILGNRMRLSNVSEIRYDDTWKSVLSPAEHNLFERKAGDTNRRLGYE